MSNFQSIFCTQVKLQCVWHLSLTHQHRTASTAGNQQRTPYTDITISIKCISGLLQLPWNHQYWLALTCWAPHPLVGCSCSASWQYSFIKSGDAFWPEIKTQYKNAFQTERFFRWSLILFIWPRSKKCWPITLSGVISMESLRAADCATVLFIFFFTYLTQYLYTIEGSNIKLLSKYILVLQMSIDTKGRHAW